MTPAEEIKQHNKEWEKDIMDSIEFWQRQLIFDQGELRKAKERLMSFRAKQNYDLFQEELNQ